MAPVCIKVYLELCFLFLLKIWIHWDLSRICPPSFSTAYLLADFFVKSQCSFNRISSFNEFFGNILNLIMILLLRRQKSERKIYNLTVCCDGRFSYNASHSQTLLQGPRNRGWKGQSPLPPQILAGIEAKSSPPKALDYCLHFQIFRPSYGPVLLVSVAVDLSWRKYAVAWTEVRCATGAAVERWRRRLAAATPKVLLIKSSGELSEFEIFAGLELCWLVLACWKV